MKKRSIFFPGRLAVLLVLLQVLSLLSIPVLGVNNAISEGALQDSASLPRIDTVASQEQAPHTEENRPADIPEEITIYAMSNLLEEYLSIPADLPQSWTFEGHIVQLLEDSDRFLSTQNQYTIVPRYEVYYYRYENGWWVGSSYPTGVPGEVMAKEYTYGDYQIFIDYQWTVTVHLVDYAEQYAQQIMIDYLDQNVTDDMSQYQIAELCCQFVAGFDYDPNFSGATGMILAGGGDCWASIDALCFMLEHQGIRCNSRNASNDPGAGSRHFNVIAELDGEYYILEAGINAEAPRPYFMTKYESDSQFFYETVEENGTVTACITGKIFDSDTPELVIPAQINGIPVTGIAANAFDSDKTILSVVLPDTIRYVEEQAFRFCSNMKQIHLPEGLEVLESGCFIYCEALEALTLPSTLKQIDPICVSECYSLSAIHVHEDNPWYASIDGVVTNKEKDTLLIFPAGKGDWPFEGPRVDGRARIKKISTLEVAYEIPEGITTIGEGAFIDVFLGTLRFPDTVTAIGRNAFTNAYFRELTLPEGLTFIDELTFYRSGIYELTLPSTLKRIEDGAFYDGLIYGELIIPDGVEYIGEGAFANHMSLHVSIPASVKEIGANAFDFSSHAISMGPTNNSTSSRTHKGAIFFDRDCKPDVIGENAFGQEVLCVYQDSYMYNYAQENNLLWYPRGEDGTIELQQEWLEGISWVVDYQKISNRYTGKEIKPALNWADEDGICPFAIRDVHLELTYSDPVNVGTCTITITGKGLLSGTLTTEYEILEPEPENDVIVQTRGGLRYKKYDDHIEIISYIPAYIQETLVIPDTLDGLPVTELALYALANCSTVRKVILPASITLLDSQCFRNCENLEAVWFTGDRPFIDKNAFDGCDVYYPVGNDTWTDELPGNTGISRWIPMCAEVGMTHEYALTGVGASCTEDTDVVYTCQTCGYSYTETVPATGHSYEMIVTEPTCEEGGCILYLCHCGDSYTANESPALGHNFEDGVCTRCSEYWTPFNDVLAGEWYEAPVLWAVDNGITAGTGNGNFSPNQTCTRAQVVTFLWRAMGEPEPVISLNPFTDVNSDDYFYKAVLWAVEKGITSGTGAGTFSPNRPCTRDQVVTFLWRTMGKPAPEKAENPFSDVAEGIYYYEPVLWAVENGITSGTSATTFAPSNPCTRAQVVTFLYRALKDK